MFLLILACFVIYNCKCVGALSKFWKRLYKPPNIYSMQLLFPETSIGSKIGKRVQNQILSLETPGARQKIVKAYQGNRCQGKMAEYISRGQKHPQPYPLRHLAELVAFHATNVSFHLFGVSLPICTYLCMWTYSIIFHLRKTNTCGTHYCLRQAGLCLPRSFFYALHT